MANEVASGTEIINRLGDLHMETGYPIIYTSADSVFQIAAHIDKIPLEKLYEMCAIAREMLSGEMAVGRVIARPFSGTSGNYTRTTDRKDFSLKPGDTMLDIIKNSGNNVMAVGKIEDIFDKQGITEAIHTKNNMDGVEKTIDYIKSGKKGLIFTNLVDFDMQFGHRNDVAGYAKALVEFDNRIPEIMNLLTDNDLLIITADHGCDPTTPSTDHSREYIPLIIWGKSIKSGINIGTRAAFSDVSATILDFLNLPNKLKGTSFKKEIEMGNNL